MFKVKFYEVYQIFNAIFFVQIKEKIKEVEKEFENEYVEAESDESETEFLMDDDKDSVVDIEVCCAVMTTCNIFCCVQLKREKLKLIANFNCYYKICSTLHSFQKFLLN